MKSITDKIEEVLQESNFKTYTDAIDAAVTDARKRGYEVDSEVLADIVGLRSSRPKNGMTTRVEPIPLTKNGKPQRQHLHIQVYNRGGTVPFELNHYIS